MFKRALIHAGNFFFRYRNAIFPLVITLLVVFSRPDRSLVNLGYWTTLGVVLAILGQAIRLLTIGYDYIDRGGREGKVYASRLVQGGIYAQVRNPMYVGNLLMAAGLLMFSASPAAILVTLPFFVFVYIAITAAEEAYLRKQFGEDYAEYCRQVPRWIPHWSGLRSSLSGWSYDWKKALRKDYGNLYLLGMTLIVLTVWRGVFLEGASHERGELRQTLLAIFASTLVYFTVMHLKKTRRLG